MNRAWIPAGALAGVSVAGLIALGPLTDSLTPPVPFTQAAVTVGTPPVNASAKSSIVQVSLNLGQTGTTKTVDATLRSHGGRETPLSTNSDSGPVGFKRTTASPSHTATATVTTKPKPVKKAVKRQTSIGATAGPNGDSGIAGGSTGGSSATGGTKSTLASDSPAP